MHCKRVLTPAAVLATLSLAVAPAFAQQHGGGHRRASSASRGSSGRTAARSAAPFRAYAAASRTYNAAPSRFFRPYYSFRPRLSLGFGLWVGYPIAYSYPYYYGDRYDSYPYPEYYPPAAYGDLAPNPSSSYPPADYPSASYPTIGAPQSADSESGPPQGSVGAQPGAASGSVSFEISPATAEVYIDGKSVGRVSDLGPTTQPLALVPGRHHVEIRVDGYQTLSIDADVAAGQVIPYQGTMQPVR